ncbi:MAG: glycosyltransferase [Moraxellaceae bacterium]|nr:glycosyltransferase [Moraxellaceae bacterium]
MNTRSLDSNLMTSRRVAYVPFEDVGNAYTVRMRKLLSEYGQVARFEGAKRAILRLASLQWWRYDSIVVNWAENDIIDRATHRVSLFNVAKLFAKTLVMRLTSRRMVYVRHNKYPHATARGEEQRAQRWIARYERLFDVVLSHSGAEVEGGVRQYCPHPLYERLGSANAAPALPALLEDLPAEYFVVFGRILPYKRIEELVDAFPADRHLVVIGPVGNEEYGQRLAARQRANFSFRPGYLSEQDAQAIVSRSAGVLISHADADVVVSGTFFYSMSLLVPVLAVATPFLEWVAPRVGSELLTVARDVPELCAKLAQHQRQPVPPEVARRVDEEFGDRAVSNALRAAIGDRA